MKFVHSKLCFITCIDSVNIIPGINSLSDVEFSLIEKDKRFTELVALEKLIIGGYVETKSSIAIDKSNMKEHGYQLATEILALPVEKAKKLIADINDANILKAIIQNDGRRGIQEAVEKRLTSINSQEGADITPETKVAPEGDGSDFNSEITGARDDLEGTKSHTAIPALKQKKE